MPLQIEVNSPKRNHFLMRPGNARTNASRNWAHLPRAVAFARHWLPFVTRATSTVARDAAFSSSARRTARHAILKKRSREFQTMKKIVAALASAMLVSTVFAQTAATDAGKAQLKANNEKAEAQATANKKKADAQHDAAKAQASANEDKASAQADANKEAAKVAQATTPEQASDARGDAAKAQAKANKKKHAAQSKADKKKQDAAKDANVAQAKADKEKVEAQNDANKSAADAKVDAAKK
ncbi:hypothetical protein [Caballeronia hypogeia]|nr:hypothetical protein [Caballeronia hypogeia]